MDLTDRESAVDAHQKERAMDEAPVGIVISDYEREDNPLVYVNEAFERITGYQRSAVIGNNCRFLQGTDSDEDAIETMRRAIEREESVTVELVNYRRDGESFWNEVTLAPIHDETGRVTSFVGFQNDVTARKEAELALEDERRDLDRLLSRIRGVLRDVTQDLVEADRREELEAAVVERVIDTEGYAAAWIGTIDPNDGSVVVNATAGGLDPSTCAFTDPTDRTDHPTARAVSTRETVVTSAADRVRRREDRQSGREEDTDGRPSEDLETGREVDTDGRPSEDLETGREVDTNGRPSEDLEAGREVDTDEGRGGESRSETSEHVDGEAIGSVAAIPLDYGDTQYGVLTVYSDASVPLDEREVAVLESLGYSIATAINALETRRVLSTDNLVELAFTVTDRDFFVVDLADRCDCTLTYEGSVDRENGALSMFFWATGTAADLVDHAAGVTGIARATPVSDGERGTLLELVLEDRSIVVDLAERGVRTRSITVEDGMARIEIELPATADSRAIATLLEDRHPGTELVAYHERERPPTTRMEFIDDLDGRLTDRQRTALRKAYLSGYYDPHRSATGERLATSMGISRATFHQHLRSAERKLIAEFFER